jgi:hypothetical protein
MGLLQFLIPYDQWTLQSPLDIGKITLRLGELVESSWWFPFWWFPFWLDPYHKPYQGSVIGSGFKIKPVHLRAFFLPVMIGTFEANSGGTSITVRMRQNWAMICFFNLVRLAYIWSFVSFCANINTSENAPALCIFFAALSGMMLLVVATFKAEAMQFREFLIDLLDIDAPV